MVAAQARLPALLLAAVLLAACTGDDPPAATALADLGRALFNERALSSGGNQSCADCHADTHAFADSRQGTPVSGGAVAGRFGTRNTPTAMYAAAIPPLALRDTPAGPRWSGGLFLDGRADTLAAQARVPLFNPNEMNLADADDLLQRLRDSPARAAYEAYFGAGSLADGVSADAVVARVSRAIAAFEGSALQPFSSKFDAVTAGRATFSEQEALGLALFRRPDKGDCAACHELRPGDERTPALFSNVTYENIGVPRNPDRAFFAADVVDSGLEATLLGRGVSAAQAAAERGRFRVPTLRNVALTSPYMHNGVFADLPTVVAFYNTRDSDPGRWAAIGETEVPATVDRRHTGNRQLTTEEMEAIVAFLHTLSDGFAGDGVLNTVVQFVRQSP